jgi:hypothetical protein
MLDPLDDLYRLDNDFRLPGGPDIDAARIVVATIDHQFLKVVSVVSTR